MLLSLRCTPPAITISLNRWTVTLVAVCGLLTGCDSGPQNQQAAPVLGVEVVTVERRDVPLLIELTGSTLGNQDVPIRARVEGFLLSMDFREGRMVKQGDLLYTIDPEPFEAAVVEARAGLAVEQTRYAKAKADLDRIRPLAEINAVSQQQLDSSVAQEAAAAAAVNAPIDGLIGLTKAKPGEFVGRDPNPVVLNTLSDIDPIRVRFAISEREYLSLARSASKRDGGRVAADEVQSDNEQSPLLLILADGSEYEYPGKVDALSQSIDAATGTFSLEAIFPNPQGILLPGQFARVRAAYETREDAVVVPRQAVTELQGRFRVFVLDESNVVDVVTVQLGPITGNDVIIEAGLDGGETVIVEGVQKVRPGMTVEPRPFVSRSSTTAVPEL